MRTVIWSELDEQPRQLDLKFDEEQQRQRNRDALAARLEEIPGEIEQERERILQRYADPVPRLFPVAVTFLLPESMAGRS